MALKLVGRIDVEICGRGFYQIIGASRRGRAFLRRVEGFDGNVVYCDDTRLTQAIADGAVTKGLRVTVNARDYVTEAQP